MLAAGLCGPLFNVRFSWRAKISVHGYFTAGAEWSLLAIKWKDKPQRDDYLLVLWCLPVCSQVKLQGAHMQVMLWWGFVLHRVVVCFIYVQSGDGWDGQWIGFHPSAKPSGHFYAFLFFSVCRSPAHIPSLCFFGYVHYFFHLFSSLLFFLLSPSSSFFFLHTTLLPLLHISLNPIFLQFACFKFLCIYRLSLLPPFDDLFFFLGFTLAHAHTLTLTVCSAYN